MKKISVIVVSFNVKPYVEQCILSLRKALREIDSEVIVVDNCSTDGTADYISLRYPDVKVLRNHVNCGFSKANNQAIRVSDSEYVLLLNPDTLVSENAISGCLAFMDRHKDAGAVGLKMLQADGVKAPESRRGFPSPFTAFCKFFHLHRLFPEVRLFNRYYQSFLSWDVSGEIDVVSGAFMMIRRSALQEVGLLDEDYFMYGEDIDLSFRLKKAGYSNWYLPFSILHYKGQSTKKTSYRYVHVFYGAMMTFLNKHYHGACGVLKWPLTAVVGVVALLSLLRIQVQALWQKVHGLVSSSEELTTYYICGSEEMQSDCRRIMEKHTSKNTFLKPIDYLMSLNNVSLEGKEIGNSRNQKPTRKVLVFDSGLFTCKQMLEQMEKLAGRQFTIAIYWPETHQIITPDEVFF